MKEHFRPIILLSTICFMTFACNTKSGDKTNYIEVSNIIGVWSMEVKTGNLNGIEEISFLPSSNLIVSDSLNFSGEDSGFSFLLPINVDLEGSWSLEKDSLFIKYKLESIDIKLNEKDLILKNSQENADQKAFETLKKEMSDKLLNYVSTYLGDSYKEASNQELFFGKIISQTTDTLVFQLNDNQFYLNRSTASAID